MLGTIDRDHVSRLIKLLAADDAPGIIAAIAEIDAQFPDYARLLEDFARVLQRVAVYQIVGAIDSDDELPDELLAEHAQSMSAADVQLFYQTALIGRRDLHLAPDPRSGAEMTLLRMLAFRPASAASGAVAGGQDQVKSALPVTAPKRASKAVQATSAQGETSTTAAWQDPDWSVLIAELGLTGAVKMLASNCAYLRREDNTLYLSVDTRSESLLTRQRKEALTDALSQHFAQPLCIDISIGEAVIETPVQEKSRLADERIEAARVTLESDPNIQALKDMFGAELKYDSIELINRSQSD